MAEGHGLVHLVGSFPHTPRLQTPADVFETAGPILSEYTCRFPDGEPQGWANFSNDSFNRATGIEPIPGKDPNVTGPWMDTEKLKRLLLDPEVLQKAWGPVWRIKSTPEEVTFAPMGYGPLLAKAYESFVAAKKAGKIAPDAKLQQGLPTPNGMLGTFDPADAEKLRSKFEACAFAEVLSICNSVPRKDLAFQWDAVEPAMLDMLVRMGIIPADPARPGRANPSILAIEGQKMARACNAVPNDVELGVHLCYGNAGGKHGIEPDDAGYLVDYANAFIPLLKRNLAWLHLPVPIARDDDAYFAPLAELRLPPGTQLFLGLVHPADGTEGAKRRIRAAKKVVRNFGVGTECGLRFFPDTQLKEILELHREAAKLAGAA